MGEPPASSPGSSDDLSQEAETFRISISKSLSMPLIVNGKYFVVVVVVFSWIWEPQYQ